VTQLQKARQMGCALLSVLVALCAYWQLLWNRRDQLFEGSLLVESVSAGLCCCVPTKWKSSGAAASAWWSAGVQTWFWLYFWG